MDGAKGTNVASYGFFEGMSLRVGHSVDTVKIIVVRVYEFAIATLLFTVSTLTFYQIQTLEGWRQDYWWEANNYGNLSAHMWGILSPAIADEMIFGKTDKIAAEEAAKKEKAEKAAEEEKAKAKIEKESAQKAAEATKTPESEGPGFWSTLWSGAEEVGNRAAKKQDIDHRLATAKKELEKAMQSLVQGTGCIPDVPPRALQDFKAQVEKKFEVIQAEAKSDFENLAGHSQDKDFGARCDNLAIAKRDKFLKSMNGEINSFLKVVKRGSLTAFFNSWWRAAKNKEETRQMSADDKPGFLQWWLAEASQTISDEWGSYEERITKVKNYHDKWQHNLTCRVDRQNYPTQMDALQAMGIRLNGAETRQVEAPRLGALVALQGAFIAKADEPGIVQGAAFNSLHDKLDEQMAQVISADAARIEEAQAAGQGVINGLVVDAEGRGPGFVMWLRTKIAALPKIRDVQLEEGSLTQRFAVGTTEWAQKLDGSFSSFGGWWSWGVQKGALPDVIGTVNSLAGGVLRFLTESAHSFIGTGLWTITGTVVIALGHPLAAWARTGFYLPIWGSVIGDWPIFGMYELVPKDPLGMVSLAFNIGAARHFPFFANYIIANYSLNYVTELLIGVSPFPTPLTSVKYALKTVGTVWSILDALPWWTKALGRYIISGFLLYEAGQFVVTTVMHKVHQVAGPVVKATKRVADAGQAVADWSKWAYEKIPAKA